MFAQAMNRENYTCLTYRLVESRTRKRISLQCIHNAPICITKIYKSTELGTLIHSPL